jgi:hypothetical protein
MNMSGRDIGLSIAAGIAAAALTLSALSFSFGGILLSSLAQLPLFMVGLSLGTHAAAIATASSVAVASVLIRFEFGIFFGLIVAVPVVVLVRQALLSRDENGTTRWYPPAGLLLAAMGLTMAVCATALPTAIWPTTEQVERARGVLENLPPEFRPGELTRETADRLVRTSLAFLPGFLGIGFFCLLVTNAMIAQGILARFGWNLRPTPRLTDLALPAWFTAGASIAGIGAIMPGISGTIGGNLAIICAMGFLFAGLAVLHAMVDKSRARGVLLAAAYGAMFLVAPAIVVVLMLGIAEPWTRLRERFAGPAPSL